MENTQQQEDPNNNNNIATIPTNSYPPPFPPTPAINPEPIRTIPLSFDSSAVSSFSITRPDNHHVYNNTSNGCGFNMVSSESVKRKRGRPRKYTGPDGGAILALSPLSLDAEKKSLLKNGPNEASYKPKNRARNVGLGKKQQKLNAICSGGRGFTANIIVVRAGEDVASKIMAFPQQGTNTICILSANGAVSNVTLRQPATYGGTVSYEGRFEIISLSGSFMHMESGGTRSRTGGMSVSLAGSDGRVMGGGVAGMLIAAAPVQVVIGSFSAEEHFKSGQSLRESLPSSSPYMMGFAVPVSSASPPFRNTYSESSEDTGSPNGWNSEQPNQGNFTYASMGHGNTHSSNPVRQEPYFPPN